MPRMLHFIGLRPWERTWWDDTEGGFHWAFPNELHPASAFMDPEQYVRNGTAVLVGDDDGTDIRTERIRAEVRAVFEKYQVELPGEHRRWTLRAMVDKLETMEVAQETARATWEAEQVEVGRPIPADEVGDAAAPVEVVPVEGVGEAAGETPV